MKKSLIISFALLCAALLALCPIIQTAAAATQQTNILDSILPDERGEGESSAEREIPDANGEVFSILGAVLVVILAAVAVVLALVYVFDKGRHRKE